jgi:hypothetical protein
MNALSLTFIALGALFIARNSLVFRIRRRRLDAIYAHYMAEIDAGNLSDPARITAAYDEFDAPSYEAMLLDLRRWTYRQFYATEPGSQP